MIDAAPVRQLYQAFVQRDYAALEASLSEDVMMGFGGRSRFAGEHHGRDAVVEVFRSLSTLRPKLADAWDVCVSDHHAVLMDWFDAKQGDQTFVGYLALVCAVEDGRIVRLFPYFEDQYSFDAFFASETAE